MNLSSQDSTFPFGEVTYEVVSGPGSISASGWYQAPAELPSEMEMAEVRIKVTP